MNKSLKIILLISVIAAIISTASYCSAPFDTETAHLISTRKTISAGGYILRKETPVQTSSGGIFEPGIPDGTRVSAGSTVGTLTSGNLDKELSSQLEEITNRINEIKRSEDVSDIYASDEARIFSAMRDMSAKIRQNAYNKNFSDASENTAQLSALIEKKYDLESAGASDQLLLSLEEKKYDLEKKLGGIREEIYSPASGYFYTATDGLENMGSEDELKKLTTEDITGFETTLTTYSKPLSCSGKITSTFAWYLVASIPKSDLGELEVGNDITVSVDESDFVKATVLAINPDDSDHVALVIKSSRNIPGIYEKRMGQFEICLKEHSGLYVPSAAIRVKDGVTGVYVMNKSNNISFRCVNILLEEKDYLIAENKYTPPDEVSFKALEIYDNILVNPEVKVRDDKSGKKH